MTSATIPYPLPVTVGHTPATPPLTRSDRLWLAVFAILAAFVWLRDRSWMAAADEVLPVLVAFPLFWWCGRPWRRCGGVQHWDWRWLAAAVLLWSCGIALNLTVLLALGWTLACWSWMVRRLEPATLPAVSHLLPLLFLAFPWLALEGARIGWYFRLSAAGATEIVYAALGFDVVRQGVLVLVQGVPISVAAECSGLNVLQAMLLVGLVIAHRHFGGSRGFWWTIPALVAAAWCANTLRIVVITASALTFGQPFTAGPFHELGGSLVLVLMFALCMAIFSWGCRWWDVKYAGSPASGRRWGQIAILAFSAAMCGDLLSAWHGSPFDRTGLPAFVLWIVPVIAALWVRVRDPGGRVAADSAIAFSAAALVLIVLGTIADMNLFRYGALACAAAAFMPRSAWLLLWFVLAVAWMPALGWAFNELGVALVGALRILLGALALGFGLLGLRFAAPVKETGPAAVSGHGRQWPAMLIAAVAVTALWEWLPLGDASGRLAAFPRAGLGFASIEVPLTDAEADYYRDVTVMKRLYRVGSEQVTMLAIDGSKNRHTVHDPLFCFRGGGWRVAAEQTWLLPGGRAKHLVLQRGGERRETVYYFTDGVARHDSALRYWWQTALRRLTFGAAGEEPVVVILQPVGTADWERLFNRLPGLLRL